MNTEIQTFNFKASTLRALIDEAGEPWFVLKDYMSIIALGNPTETVKMFDDDEFSTTEVIDSIGRRQQTYIISEPVLYRLIMKSCKPEAREFQRWVTHEVLPQIRKTGGYIPTTDTDDDMTILAKAVLVAQKTIDFKDRQPRAKDAQIKELEPKAQALDAFTDVEDRLLIREAAKILSNAGTKFAFPPTVRITRKGLALLHTRLGETRLNETLENTIH